MKILIAGTAFAIGMGVMWYEIRGRATERIILTAPEVITRFDTLVRTDTIKRIDTFRDTDLQKRTEMKLDEVNRELKRVRRDLRSWVNAYQKLRRQNPEAASVFSQIYINEK